MSGIKGTTGTQGPQEIVEYKIVVGDDGEVSAIETVHMIAGSDVEPGMRRDWNTSHVNMKTMELNEAGIALARSHLYPQYPNASYVKAK